MHATKTHKFPNQKSHSFQKEKSQIFNHTEPNHKEGTAEYQNPQILQTNKQNQRGEAEPGNENEIEQYHRPLPRRHRRARPLLPRLRALRRAPLPQLQPHLQLSFINTDSSHIHEYMR